MTGRGLSGAFVAGAAFVLACAVNAVWVSRSAAPPSFDEAWYLETSFRFWNLLADGRFLDFAAAYAGAFRFKAPLVSLLPLPLYAALEPSYRAAVLTNLAALALLALSVYRLGRRWFSETAGGLAAALALLTPLTAHLSRLYFVETWLTALTAAFLWRCAESDGLTRRREAPALGLLAGLGLLTKALFPLAAAAPTAVLIHERRPRWHDVEPTLKRAAAVAAAIALTWYGPNLVYVAGYSLKASFGSIAAHYAAAPALSPAALLRFWSAFARDALSWPLTLLLAGALARLGPRRVLAEPGLRVALAWLCPLLLLASLGRSKELRFTAAALPGAALALAGALDLLTRGARWRAPVLALSLLLPADVLLRQAFGARLLPGPSLIPAATAYGGPPAPAPAWDARALPAELARRIGRPAVVVAGSEHRMLNANLLAAWAELDRLPLTFIHYGHMESKVENAVARLADKDATHILFVSGLPAGELVPEVPTLEAGLKGLVAAGKLPFRSLGALDWAPAGLSAELFERTGPLKMTGALRR